MEAFREFLDGWLAESGWTPAQLARATGIGQNVISRWRGREPVRPSDKNLERLAPIVGVPYEELLRLAGYLPGEPDLALRVEVDPDLAALTAAWPRLEDGLKRAIKILASASTAAALVYFVQTPGTPRLAEAS